MREGIAHQRIVLAETPHGAVVLERFDGARERIDDEHQQRAAREVDAAFVGAVSRSRGLPTRVDRRAG
jgi:hypothetical protein